MAFESGFSAGSQLQMVDHPLAGLVERLASGYKTGAEMANLPEQTRLANALREAQIQQEKAKAGLETEGAREKKLLSDYLQAALGGQMPAGVSGDTDLAQTIMQKKLFGIEETPQQKQVRELETARLKAEQAKKLEKEQGTTSSITNTQNRVQGIDATLPLLDSLRKLELPYKLNLGGTTSAKEFQSLINQATEQYMTAKGLSSGEGIFDKTRPTFTRGLGESVSSYRKRLDKLKDSLIRERTELVKGLKTDIATSQDVGNTNKNYTIDDLQFTANKYGMTIDEVKAKLGQG